MHLVRRPIASALIATLAALSMAGRAGHAQFPEQRVVTGIVKDSTGREIPYVNVILPRGRLIVSNQGGEFSFQFAGKDAVPITIRRLGFRAVDLRLPPGGDTTITIVLAPTPQPLQTTVIQTERMRTLDSRGFYSRLADREKGVLRGEFITPEEVERFKPSRATQLLEARNGIQVRRSGSCHVTTMCWVVLGSGGCVATVYLDGKRLNQLGEAQGTQTDPRSAPYLDDLLSPTSIAGIEVYPRGGGAPPQYQALAGSCAIVLIWTR